MGCCALTRLQLSPRSQLLLLGVAAAFGSQVQMDAAVVPVIPPVLDPVLPPPLDPGLQVKKSPKLRVPAESSARQVYVDPQGGRVSVPGSQHDSVDEEPRFSDHDQQEEPRLPLHRGIDGEAAFADGRALSMRVPFNEADDGTEEAFTDYAEWVAAMARYNVLFSQMFPETH